MRSKGLFLQISDELNAAFHAEVERRFGRALRKGDITNAGEEAIKAWMAKQ